MGLCQSFRINPTKKSNESNIYLLDFSKLCEYNSFPKFVEFNEITCSLSSIESSNAFIVFVSHRWLRGSPQCDGYSGQPHPDNIHNDVFTLCTAECTNDISSSQYYSECNLLAWNGDRDGYLNRSWCRLEIFYGANIPTKNSDKLEKFEGELQRAALNGRRPHYVDIKKDTTNFTSPIMLPYLDNSRFDDYYPEDGFVTNHDDVALIKELLDDLLPYMSYTVEKVNENGERHGHGKYSIECGVYEGKCVHDRPQGYGKCTYMCGDVYRGQWVEGVRCGEGSLTFKCGDVYSGMWRDDKRNGHGTIVFIDGNKYTGMWVDNAPNGNGEMVYMKKKVTYVGNWVEGKENGKGKATYENGDTYEGNWVDGTKQGKGVYTYSGDGGVYDGDWVDGIEHGRGVFKYGGCDDEYDGAWANGKEHGYGRYNGDGVVYEGNWREGMYHGQGTLSDSGDVYTGTFENGKKSGRGKLTYSNGDVYIGQWKRGRKHGNGVLTYEDGDVYNGEWVMGREEGKGMYTYSDGSSYQGDWKNGLEHGRGIYKSSDGDVYEGLHLRAAVVGQCFNFCGQGEWVKGKEHGYGTMTYSDGEIYEGEWARGKRLDTAKITAANERLIRNLTEVNKKVTSHVSKAITILQPSSFRSNYGVD